MYPIYFLLSHFKTAHCLIAIKLIVKYVLHVQNKAKNLIFLVVLLSL